MNDELDKFDQAQQPPMINFVLCVDDANLVFRALSELPHRVSDPLIRNLMQQAQSQVGKPQ